ncbi:MAG: hypothetical protein WCS87_15315, partial [Methylococcaceae bacterium]
MTYKNQTTFFASADFCLNKKYVLILIAAFLGFSQQVLAHVEYYDLNQGKQIGDLTAAGKTASTAQYGSTPAGVVALGGKVANGLGVISTQQDLALSNPSQWNATNQSYTGVGSFTGVTYTPTLSSATVDVNDVTDFGWGNGTKTTLGDSHKVGMFNFRLSQRSNVTISWNVYDGEGNFFDNGFTLYSGLLQYQGHDDANEKLNPKNGPVTKVQDVLDGLTAPADVQGITSSYRNTTATGPGAYVGQFNALANWGQANVSGNWSNVAFIQAVNGNAGSVDGYAVNAGDTLETLAITLDAGNYTIAASGALGAIANLSAGTLGAVETFGQTNLHGQLTFSAKAVQTIGEISLIPSTLTVDDTATVSATATSNLDVTFTSSTPAVCTINGTTITGNAVGTCTIMANQAGNSNYSPAPQKILNVTITKANQIITFSGATSLILGGTSNISANSSSGSGIPLIFSSTTTAICTVTGSTVTSITAGVCIIAANQAGNANYTAATPVTQSITIDKVSQTLTFGTAPTITVGKTGTVTATANSGLAASFSSSTPTVCTVSGSVVTGKATGTCTIAANQAGNANYNAATAMTQSITIGKGAQTLIFGEVPVITVGSTDTVTATANSGLAASFSSST